MLTTFKVDGKVVPYARKVFEEHTIARIRPTQVSFQEINIALGRCSTARGFVTAKFQNAGLPGLVIKLVCTADQMSEPDIHELIGELDLHCIERRKAQQQHMAEATANKAHKVSAESKRFRNTPLH